MKILQDSGKIAIWDLLEETPSYHLVYQVKGETQTVG